MQPVRLTMLLLVISFSVDISHAALDQPYGVIPASVQPEGSAVSAPHLQAHLASTEHIIVVGSSPAFELEFADVRDHTGAGFDHPQLGIDRRAVAVAVFERIGQILDGEPGMARIRIDSRSPWLDANTLAVGIPYYPCVNGFQKPIIYNALRNNVHVHEFEGELLVNFDLPLAATLDTPPAGQYDLYTLLFHEITHVLGFVGFNVGSDGTPADCGGARMLPEVARYITGVDDTALWVLEGDQLQFTGDAGELPSTGIPMNLGVPGWTPTGLRLATSALRVSGHWLPEDFSNREGVLMLREPFPSGQKRRNMTPETKSVLSEVLGYRVNQEVRGLTGSWVDTDLNKQGFSLHFISANSFAVYFFGFNDFGENLWLVGLHNGEFQLGDELTIPMFEASGGRFTQPLSLNPEEHLWGSLQIRFLDCLRAEAKLNGTDGAQDMTLLQLAGVDQLQCY